MKALKFALENQNYDLAARVLVYGWLKATVNEIEKEEKRRPKSQPERTEARILQPGT